MTSVEATQKNIRYDALDGMRGVAAIVVMLYHYNMHSSLSIFQHAPVAVDIFFILSGFVIAHSYSKRLYSSMTSVEYLLRRVIRLYPMFIIGLLIGAPILYVYYRTGFSDFSTKDIINLLLYNGLFIPSVSAQGSYDFGSTELLKSHLFPMNPPAWSLFFELVASIVFVFVVRLKQKILFAIICASYAIMIVNGIWVSVANNRLGIDLDQGWATYNFFGGVPRVFFGFFLGVFIYSISRGERLGAWKGLCQKYLTNILYIYLILILIFVFPKSFKGLYVAFVIAFIAPSLVFAGSLIDIRHSFTKKLAIHLGWISYPVYCLHYPIGRAVFLLMDGASYYMHLLPALIASVLTTGIAAILTRYLDEPIRGYFTKMLFIPAPATQRS